MSLTGRAVATLRALWSAAAPARLVIPATGAKFFQVDSQSHRR
jgi:hypothetical protein